MTINGARTQRNRGFSLVEMIITMAIFFVILIALYQIFEGSQRTFLGGRSKAAVQQNARLALDDVVKRLRVAGYFPENFATPAASPALVNPVQVATNSRFAVYGDLDGAGASNVFMYCLDGTTLRRTRGAQGVAATYNCTAGEVMAEEIQGLKFVYLDANNTTIPNPLTATYNLDSQTLNAAPTFATTTQRAAVRTVLITLEARENVAGQAPQDYTLTASLRLRNIQ
jgi:prepilin-type N-terminal cleavage/methylation domain-containing protein